MASDHYLAGDGHFAWLAIGFVEEIGTTNAPKEYSSSDKFEKTGKYQYRLKQIDRDGNFSFSPELEMTVGEAPLKIALEQNYPNPFNPTMMIGFTHQETGFTAIKIYDAIGWEVAVVANEVLEAEVHHQI